MSKKILLLVRERKKHLLGILLLLPIIVLLLPFPISQEQLVSNEWCYPFLEWRFMEDGSFEQSYVLIGEFDSVGYLDRGVWSISGGSVQVNIHKSEILNQREFKVRSVGLGTFLWSYGDFRGQDDRSVFIVFPCSENG